jgi:hypothetical protein
MTKLSITRAWNETAEILKRDASALFIIAFALIALPQVIYQALAPQDPSAEPGAAGALLMLALLATILVLSIAGSIAISALALGRERVVGSAIALGFRRSLSLFGASLLIGLVFLVIGVPLMLLAGLDPQVLSAGASPGGGGVAVGFLILLILGLALWVRFMLMTPAAADGPGGSVALIRRSWHLTKGHTLRLIGFIVLMIIAGLAVVLAVTAVAGIIVSIALGTPQPGSLGTVILLLVGGVVNAVFLMILTTMVARIYTQLGGGAPADASSPADEAAATGNDNASGI